MDRFDFEQKIFSAWNVVDDIRLAREALENENHDVVDNLLLGMETKYSLIFSQLQEDFEKLVKNNSL